MGFAGLMVPFVIPRYLTKVSHESQWELVYTWGRHLFMPWITVAVSAYLLVDHEAPVINIRTFDDINFRRSWYDLLMQSNSALTRRLNEAVMLYQLNDSSLYEKLVADSDHHKFRLAVDRLGYSDVEEGNDAQLEDRHRDGQSPRWSCC